nr:unnamed protein product [Digitaria exilis]
MPTRPPPSTLPTSWAVGLGRPAAPSFPCLKLGRGGEMAALRPRCLVARAQMNHGRNDVQLLPFPNHFVEEMNTIIGRRIKISATCEGFLHREALSTSACVCGSAGKAVIMASQLVDSASLAAGGGLSSDTVHKTLQEYVNVFLRTAEDSYNRRFYKDNVMWFLDALRGLASISHILLEDALEALSHTHPKESLSEYAFNNDVKKMRREFNGQIDDLEYVIWNRCRYNVLGAADDPKRRSSYEVLLEPHASSPAKGIRKGM